MQTRTIATLRRGLDTTAALDPPSPRWSRGFRNSLGRLRTLGLVEYPGPGMVRASGALFL